MILACFLLALLTACSGGNKSSPNEQTKLPIPQSSGEPSSADLIQAVRDSVSGKTYPQQVSHTEQQRHTCTQEDVELDPNAKHNPELARCPHVGAVYAVPVTTWATETRPCAALTAPDSVWSVQKTGNDTWRLSQFGSVWDVTKQGGQASSVGTTVRVSQFGFGINAHQPC